MGYENVAAKIVSTGNEHILLTDRGTSFGYNVLVSDFCSLPIMKEMGYPVVFDVTHSIQQPGGLGATSGGDRRFVPTLSRAALAAGCAPFFIEAHQNPERAPSGGPNMVPIDELESLLLSLTKLDNLTKGI